jgi:hypothetical protein
MTTPPEATMPEFDHGIKIIAETTGQQLARLAGITSQRWEPVESTLPVTTELLADRVFPARRGRERFLVYFEFYTQWDSDAPWDMLAKSGLLSRREWLPTVCVPVVLQRRGYNFPEGELRLEAAGGPTQQLWFREVLLWELVPEAWWENEPGLMALYPLTHHRRQPREAVRHAAQAIEQQLTGTVERANGLFLLNIFAGLAYPRLDVEKIIGREKMQESRFSREMREEGRLEGRREGELTARRSDILDILQERFGSRAKQQVEATLNSIEDVDQLKRLHRLAWSAADMNQFRAGLPRQTTTP